MVLPLSVTPAFVLSLSAVSSLPDVPSWFVRLLFGLAFVVVVVFAMLYRMAFASAMYTSDPTAHEEKVNCPSCGARTATEPAACDYCEEPLPGDATAGREPGG